MAKAVSQRASAITACAAMDVTHSQRVGKLNKPVLPRI